MTPLIQPIRFSSSATTIAIRNTFDLPPSEADATIVVICIPEPNSSEPPGFSIISARSETGEEYCVVDKIQPKSPASVS